MARTTETCTPEELESGGGLKEPGKYHFLVNVIKDGIMPNSDTPMNHPGLAVVLKVLEGEHAGETTGLMLGDPNMSHKDHGEFAKKKQNAFLIASNVLTIEQLNGQTVSYDEQSARGSQIIAEVERQKDRDGNLTEFLDWKYANIFHVDDPRAKDVPKNQEELANIPSQFRHAPEWFEPITKVAKKPDAGGNGAGKQGYDVDGL